MEKKGCINTGECKIKLWWRNRVRVLMIVVRTENIFKGNY